MVNELHHSDSVQCEVGYRCIKYCEFLSCVLYYWLGIVDVCRVVCQSRPRAHIDVFIVVKACLACRGMCSVDVVGWYESQRSRKRAITALSKHSTQTLTGVLIIWFQAGVGFRALSTHERLVIIVYLKISFEPSCKLLAKRRLGTIYPIRKYRSRCCSVAFPRDFRVQLLNKDMDLMNRCREDSSMPCRIGYTKTVVNALLGGT
jgi:hypothetical protein